MAALGRSVLREPRKDIVADFVDKRDESRRTGKGTSIA